PQHVVGRRVAELELVPSGGDLALYELTYGVADHPLLFGPLEHGRHANQPARSTSWPTAHRPYGRFVDTRQEGMTPVANASILISRKVAGGRRDDSAGAHDNRFARRDSPRGARGHLAGRGAHPAE